MHIDDEFLYGKEYKESSYGPFEQTSSDVACPSSVKFHYMGERDSGDRRILSILRCEMLVSK